MCLNTPLPHPLKRTIARLIPVAPSSYHVTEAELAILDALWRHGPANSKLTPTQKFERCKQCVIYLEHQKHKYQLALPAAALTLIATYLALRLPIRDQVNGFLEKIDGVMGKATFDPAGGGPESELTSLTGGIIPYAEIIMIAGSLIIFAYMVRFIEYVVFKLKV